MIKQTVFYDAKMNCLGVKKFAHLGWNLLDGHSVYVSRLRTDKDGREQAHVTRVSLSPDEARREAEQTQLLFKQIMAAQSYGGGMYQQSQAQIVQNLGNLPSIGGIL